jgi:hypothetical protein
VSAVISALKVASTAVAQTCTMSSEVMLIRIDRKRLYDLTAFEEQQNAQMVCHPFSVSLHQTSRDQADVHLLLQATTCTTLQHSIGKLRDVLVSLFLHFKADSEEVYREWLAFVRRADERLLESLTVSVRHSLHDLARVLHNEQKGADGLPVFVLRMFLDTNGRWASLGSISPAFAFSGRLLHNWRNACCCCAAEWNSSPRCNTCLRFCTTLVKLR